MSTVPFQLRPADASDEPFLVELFAATHGQQFALLPLAPAQREMLVRMQFEAQRSGYRQQFPASEHSLILYEDQPAGRIWINEGDQELWIIDLVIHPGFRRRGLGTAVLRHVLDRAESRGVPAGLFVDRFNDPAYALYQRLGFEICSGENQMYVQMRRHSGVSR